MSLYRSAHRTTSPVVWRLDDRTSMVDCCSAFLDSPYLAFLDSALVTPSLGRYSYVTGDPFLVVRAKNGSIELDRHGEVERCEGNPFIVLQGLLRQYALAPLPGLPPFQGGVVGYWAYELGRHLERLPHSTVDDLHVPEMNVAFYDWVIARDHLSGGTWALATGLPEGISERAKERLAWVEERLGQGQAPHDQRPSPLASGTTLSSNLTRDGYMRAVQRVKEYIVTGEVYQANVTQRFETRYTGRPWDLYRRLRDVNPAPFGAYLQYPELTVLSASPEQFLRREGETVSARPMKGTRPRGRTPEEDDRLARELQASEKDRAENLMIVDLLRNDLGRVCAPGSVEVPEIFAIEGYQRVWQMVSTVTGRLPTNLDALDLLQACFPGGSVTGAPKIRAMEVIDELESVERSVYCGALGYIGFNGAMMTSIPIRIMLVKGQRVLIPVGAGIVADSDPEAEYEETLHKARGSFEALGLDA